jgi:hypothetical protein
MSVTHTLPWLPQRESRYVWHLRLCLRMIVGAPVEQDGGGADVAVHNVPAHSALFDGCDKAQMWKSVYGRWTHLQLLM